MLTAILLCVLILLSYAPTATFATEQNADEPTQNEQTEQDDAQPDEESGEEAPGPEASAEEGGEETPEPEVLDESPAPVSLDDTAALGSVSMQTEVDGEITGSATIPAGVVADHLSGVDVPEGAVFQSAVVAGDGGEREIVRAGEYDGDVYYSVPGDETTGIGLLDGETLRLVFLTEYRVSYEYDDSLGAVSGPKAIKKGVSLEIVCEPAESCFVSGGSYQTGGVSAELIFNEDNTATIPAGQITGDILITVCFVEEASEAPLLTLSFSALSSTKGIAAFDDVELYVEVNGILDAATQTVPSGVVAENLGGVSVPAGAVFQRAVVRRDDGGTITEAEIVCVGEYNGETYYSLQNDEDTGILLLSNETLVLIYRSEFDASYVFDSALGSVTGETVAAYGTNLPVSCTPAKYCHIESAVYTVGGGSAVTLPLDEYGYASIPAAEITGDVVVTVEFVQDAAYHVIGGYSGTGLSNFVQGYVNARKSLLYAGTTGCGNIAGSAYGTAQDYVQHNFQVTPGGTAYIVVFSKALLGSPYYIGYTDFHAYYLVQFTINGEEVNVPTSYTAGSTATTTLSNGSVATITLLIATSPPGEDHDVHNDGALITDGDSDRCKYLITVTDVQEDLNLYAFFNEDDDRRMTIKGLDGIEITGASGEETEWQSIGDVGYHYYYGLQTTGSNIYKAYYEEAGSNLSYNIYMYDVEAGYNPNTVTFDVYYNGVLATNLTDARGDAVVLGAIASVIANLGTTYRHFDDLLAGYAARGYTYAFSLYENSAYTQVLIMDASPYQYTVNYDLNGGEYASGAPDPAKYSVPGTDGLFHEIDPAYHTVDSNPDVYLPSSEPTREGYYFMGWKPGDGSDAYYGNELFAIGDGTVGYAQGNASLDDGMYFTFVAQWKSKTETTDTADYYFRCYKETPGATGTGVIEHLGKTYTLYYSEGKIGTVGNTIVSLNSHEPEDDVNTEYVLNSTESVVRIESLHTNAYQAEYGLEAIVYYYDIERSDVTIQKTLEGDLADRTKTFEIALTLKDGSGSPVSGSYDCTGAGGWSGGGTITFMDGTATIALLDGQSITIVGIENKSLLSVAETEYTLYTTAYSVNGGSDQNDVTDLAVGADIAIEVKNVRTTTPPTGAETNAASGLLLALFGGLPLLAILTMAEKCRISGVRRRQRR